MATLEDGTIFTQSTYGIDTEVGKIMIKPRIIEKMNCKAKMFSISNDKPVIALIECKNYDNSPIEDNQNGKKDSFISNIDTPLINQPPKVKSSRIVFKN